MGLSEESEERLAVVGATRAWVGTRYHHMADVMGHGVDCGMIGVRVFVDLGMIEPFDPRPYPKDFMIHADEERYLGIVRKLTRREFEVADERPQAGDFVLWRYGRLYAHGGIVTGNPHTGELGWPWVVHAYADAGRVVEQDMTGHAIMCLPNGAPRPLKGFSFWGAAR